MFWSNMKYIYKLTLTLINPVKPDKSNDIDFLFEIEQFIDSLNLHVFCWCIRLLWLIELLYSVNMELILEEKKQP